MPVAVILDCVSKIYTYTCIYVWGCYGRGIMYLFRFRGDSDSAGKYQHKVPGRFCRAEAGKIGLEFFCVPR